MKRFINNSYKPKFGCFRDPTLFAAILATQLLCLTGRAATNVLANPGFEIGALSGWTTFFTGECSANCSGGAVESTNNKYYNGGQPGGSNVLTHSGNYVGKEYGQFTGAANTAGMYQEAAAAQGSVWSAGGFALSYHQDFISGGNTFWLEVSFRDSGSNV